MTSNSILPSLVVFDLDFTLWDCGGLWIDTTSWPFRHEAEGNRIHDAEGRRFRVYPDVPAILNQLEESDCAMALASRTEQPAWAEWVLRTWNLWDRFCAHQIYPGSKITHFQRLSSDLGIDFEEMIFFDDEPRNIIEVGELGVTAVEVANGLNAPLFEEGISRWADA